MSTRLCSVCAAPAPLKCSACQEASYCTKEHQKQHWKTHKTQCRPFEVVASPELGRHLVMSRDVSVETILLTESPLVIGPRYHDDPPPICLGCLIPINLSTCERCPQCVWPACSSQCPGLTDPTCHGVECRIFMNNKRIFLSGDLRYDAILPLRILLLQKISPSKWNTIKSMDAHEDKRDRNSPISKSTQDRIVSYLRDEFLKPLSRILSGKSDYPTDSVPGLLTDCSEKTIHRIVNVLDVNALEIPGPGVGLSALFPTAYLLEHSCICNTRHTFDSNLSSGEKRLPRIIVRAATALKKGDHISTMYTHTLWNTMARRDHLRSIKSFDCKCPRCSDPRELGSLMSALRCLTCPAPAPPPGAMLPLDPLDENSDWSCDNCGARLNAQDVLLLLNNIEQQVQDATSSNASIESLETLLKKLEVMLHPNHQHCVELKHLLLQSYGHRPGYEMDRLSLEQLQMKRDLCEQLLEVFKRVDPYESRLPLYTAVCLVELFRARLEQLQRISQKLDAQGKRTEVQELNKLLDRCTYVLQYELENTSGSTLRNLAGCILRDELKQFMKKNNIS